MNIFPRPKPLWPWFRRHSIDPAWRCAKASASNDGMPRELELSRRLA